MSNTKRTETTARFTIDFFNHTITGTKASFTKAGRGVGEEYLELAAKIAAHPDYKLVVKEQKYRSTKSKRTYDGMDFPFMEAFIATQENSEALMKEYKSVKTMAKNASTKTYPLTKKWFLGKFHSEEKPFDMDEARKTISNYQIAMAVVKAADAA